MAEALTVLCVLAVATLLVAEARGSRGLRLVSKSAASLCFIGVGLARGLGSEGPLAAFVLAGLILGAVGDVALLFHGERAFLAGLGAFLLGHLAYAAAFATWAPLAAWISLLTVPAGLLGAGTLWWLWARLGPMRLPVVAYVLVICGMLAGAFAAAKTGDPSAEQAAVGAALFALSDLSVARDRFVTDSFVNKAWGLPAYYVGQLFIAWALGPA